MAGFQTASLMAPDQPVLYGTTLAISLMGSVAVLSSGGISVTVARVEYAQGLADNASAAITTGPVSNAPEPEAIKAQVVSGLAEVPVIATSEQMSAIPVAHHQNAAPIGLEAVQIAVPKLAKADLAASSRLELEDAPRTISAPVIARLRGQQLEPPVAAPAAEVVAAQPNQSFTNAFEAIPTPSLAVLPDQHDAVPAGFTGSDAPALAMVVAKPGQSQTGQLEVANAPAPVPWQTKLIEFPAVSTAIVQTVARPSKTVVALAQVASKLTATSGTRPAETALRKAEAKPAPEAATVRLINAPELRKFNLARIHAPARTPTAALARSGAKPAQSGKIRTTGAKDKLVGDVVFHRLMVTVSGSPEKPLDVRIGVDMKPSIRVGDLLGLVSDRMDSASANRFVSAASADQYVSLPALRESGFSVSYNPATDSISIGAGD